MPNTSPALDPQVERLQGGNVAAVDAVGLVDVVKLDHESEPCRYMTLSVALGKGCAV